MFILLLLWKVLQCCWSYIIGVSNGTAIASNLNEKSELTSVWRQLMWFYLLYQQTGTKAVIMVKFFWTVMTGSLNIKTAIGWWNKHKRRRLWNTLISIFNVELPQNNQPLFETFSNWHCDSILFVLCCSHCVAHYDTKRFPMVIHVFKGNNQKLSVFGGLRDVYVRTKSYKMCGYQRPLVCSLETRIIKTNLFDSKGISADLKKTHVKMTCKPI